MATRGEVGLGRTAGRLGCRRLYRSAHDTGTSGRILSTHGGGRARDTPRQTFGDSPRHLLHAAQNLPRDPPSGPAEHRRAAAKMRQRDRDHDGYGGHHGQGQGEGDGFHASTVPDAAP